MRPLSTFGDTRQEQRLGLEIGQSRAPDGFHVDEDILRLVVATDHEAITLEPVEPFHANRLERPCNIGENRGIDPIQCSTREQIRIRADRRAQIDREHGARLQPARPANHFAVQPSTFRERATIMIAQHGKMDEHIAFAGFTNDEAEPAHHIEPFDRPRDLDHVFRLGAGYEPARPYVASVQRFLNISFQIRQIDPLCFHHLSHPRPLRKVIMFCTTNEDPMAASQRRIFPILVQVYLLAAYRQAMVSSSLKVSNISRMR